jgi:hypothetical protein
MRSPIYISPKKSMNLIKSLSIGVFSSLMFSLPALADQCAYITKEQALLAVARLNVGQTIYELCEPCGETRPQAVGITSLAAETVGYEDYWQVKVNNSGIDLAYTFIQSGINGQAVNLAGVAGCPASDVSNTLILR